MEIGIKLFVEEYLDKIRPYLKDINDIKHSHTWEIQLTITNNIISSKDDNAEECTMHSKSDNIEIMIIDAADEIIEKLFNSVKNRYQNNLQVILLMISNREGCIAKSKGERWYYLAFKKISIKRNNF